MLVLWVSRSIVITKCFDYAHFTNLNAKLLMKRSERLQVLVVKNVKKSKTTMRNQDVFGVMRIASIRNETDQYQKNSCQFLALIFDQLGSEMGACSA